MKILWVTNIPLPEASLLLNEKPTPFGGWLVNFADALSQQNDIDLSIAFPREQLNEIFRLQGEHIKYFAFPSFNYKESHIRERTKDLEKIIDECKPDIVNIFGTEYSHTSAMVEVCNKKCVNVVITIQGLVSVISNHYFAYLPQNETRKATFRDFIKRDNINLQKEKFRLRGEFEIKALKQVKHVIGRTTWDKACAFQINPSIVYHHCNETLRNEFYLKRWNIEECEKHSIFVSQGSYPIKGLHMMLQAMSIILKKFPDSKLYIAGPDITKYKSLKDKLRITSYGNYLRKLIREYKLRHNVVFTGLLNGEAMCDRYLKSHVFVSPSIIENESNSLSEAKILGLPCVASFVGGVADRINDKEDGYLYQFDAPYMLAHYVCEIFGNKELSLTLSHNARERALKALDKVENTNRIIEIYKKIISESSKSMVTETNNELKN